MLCYNRTIKTGCLGGGIKEFVLIAVCLLGFFYGAMICVIMIPLLGRYYEGAKASACSRWVLFAGVVLMNLYGGR